MNQTARISKSEWRSESFRRGFARVASHETRKLPTHSHGVQPFVTSDYAEDPRFVHDAAVDNTLRVEGIVAMAAVPFQLDGRVLAFSMSRNATDEMTNITRSHFSRPAAPTPRSRSKMPDCSKRRAMRYGVSNPPWRRSRRLCAFTSNSSRMSRADAA